MEVESYDIKILSLREKESKKRQWPWLEITGYSDETGKIKIHFYPWENRRERQTLETSKTYTLDLIKYDKEIYYRLDKIRAEII